MSRAGVVKAIRPSAPSSSAGNAPMKSIPLGSDANDAVNGCMSASTIMSSVMPFVGWSLEKFCPVLIA